jgi:hypothetical protein
VPENEITVKRTPYGNIAIYGDPDTGYRFVLMDRLYEMAHVYAKKEGWSAEQTKLIGGSPPF